MQIVLVEPEIPGNTGNIARTCALTGTKLHLVRPLGFSTRNKYLKRAGLDYWDDVEITYWDSLESLLRTLQENNFYLATTRATTWYTDVHYQENDFLIFGKETRGLPDEIISRYPSRCIRIPMLSDERSLNLANSAAIILYEALRQLRFPGLK